MKIRRPPNGAGSLRRSSINVDFDLGGLSTPDLLPRDQASLAAIKSTGPILRLGSFSNHSWIDPSVDGSVIKIFASCQPRTSLSWSERPFADALDEPTIAAVSNKYTFP